MKRSTAIAKKILIVGDNPDILDATKLILEYAGYVVETSTKDGKHIKRLLKNTPHLIILDVLLSGADGREICRQLKHQVKTRHIPIIMISAHPDAKETSFAAGAEDFIAKPFDIDELLAKVAQYT